MSPPRHARAAVRAAGYLRRLVLAAGALVAACAVEPQEPGPPGTGARADALGEAPDPRLPYDFAWLPEGPLKLEVELAPAAGQILPGSQVEVRLESDPPVTGQVAAATGPFVPFLRRGSAEVSLDAGTWLWVARLSAPDAGAQTAWSAPASFTVDPAVWTPGWLQTSPVQFQKGESYKLTPWRVPGEVVFGFTEPAPGVPSFSPESLDGPDAGWVVFQASGPPAGSLVNSNDAGVVLMEQFTSDAPARLETRGPVRFPVAGRVSLGLASNSPSARVWLVGPRVSSSIPGAPLIGVGTTGRGELAWSSSATNGRWVSLGDPWPAAYPADAGSLQVALAPYDAGVLALEYDSTTGRFDLAVDGVIRARGLVYGVDAGVRVPAALVVGHTGELDPSATGTPGTTRLWDVSVLGPASAGAYLSPPLPLGARPVGAQRLGHLEWTEEESGGTVTLSLQHGTTADPWHDMWNLEAGGPDNSNPVRYPTSGVDLSAINLDGPYQLRLVAYFSRTGWPGPSLKDWSFTWKGSRLEAVPPQRFRAAPGARVVLSAQVLDWQGDPMGGVPVDFASLDALGVVVTPNPHLTNPRGLAQATVQLAAGPAQQDFMASAPVLVEPRVKFEVDTRAVPPGALVLNPDVAPETRLACGQPWSFDARGKQGPSWTWSAPVAPAGLAVDPQSGVATWTPGRDQAGPQAVVLRAEADGEFWDFPLALEVNCTQDFALRTQCGCGASGALGGLAWLAGLLLLRRRRR